MRKITRQTILKFTQSSFADFLDSHMRIPQNYSFIVIGSHGVGLHSLLYYLSLCQDKNGEYIYPMPLYMFTNNFDLYRCLTIPRFYQKMFPMIKKKDVKWCLTFDRGNRKNTLWIQNNIQHNVPAITIVRDPILALTSAFNYEIFFLIHSSYRQINTTQIYEEIYKNFLSIFGFKTNIDEKKTRITKILYVDCNDLIGDKTYPTMQKIADFLDFKVSFHESFRHSINSPMQRYFANPIIYNNQELYLSSFPHFFRITCYPHYFSPNYCNNLGYTYQQPYSSPLFPNQELYLFSKSQIEITQDLGGKIEQYLLNFKNILDKYNKQKITSTDLIDLIIKHGHLEYIQTMLKEETSIIPKEIVQRWEIYLHFMQIKG